MKLRDYQIDLEQNVRAAWDAGCKNVLMVSPTGSGKTHTKTHIAATMGLVTCNIAHRQELVQQISESLAAFGIYHNIVAPTGVVRFCVARHVRRFGRSYLNQNAPMAVTGVQTLLRRQDTLKQFISRVRLWDIDEGHHALPDNQWGKAAGLFQNAIGLGVTATPLRCDRKSLDGVFDHMVVGPSMRNLIDQGHLSEYRIFCPPESIDTSNVRISGSTGEYVKKDLVQENEKSKIVGDVVAHYLQIAPGKRGLTFAVNVETATKLADAYNAAGVRAAVVSADTPDTVRTDLLDRLARGDVMQLVNVDLFGEGMDCPALEVVSMARPTQSYGLYVQQFGRVLRTMEGKSHGIVIDHVGNVIRHGLPDAPREWSLSVPERGQRSKTDPDIIGLTACTSCYKPYERHRVSCPYCGARPEPVARSLPEHVDGNLIELDPAKLAEMRGEIDRIDGEPMVPRNMPANVVLKVTNNWRHRQKVQTELRDTIATWAGVFKHGYGETDPEIQKRFYLTFGVDVMTAQQLNAADANKLADTIRGTLI